ncbi:MAG: type II toxin-antitoxin system RelE/ParE family toxin [Chlorobi bacterium]|nr:type II toxin-antitoxin system RelE/ParE family toxin [Chlorobiota bacterium]
MARRKVIWSPRSKNDLFEILDYYYQRNGNKSYSQKLHRQFKNATNLLTKYANIGIKTDVNNVRNLIVGEYSIFYRVEKETIEIITIWDCRQDPKDLELQ